MGKTIRIAVLDTGFDRNLSSAKLCPDASPLPDSNNNKHGTIVADLIARFAGDADYCIYPIRVIDDGENDDIDEVVMALRVLKVLHIDVLNLSVEGIRYSKAEKNAIKMLLDSGIVVFAAAGNHKNYLGKYSCKVYPACDDPRIVVVGTYSKYSSYGPRVNIKTRRDAGCVGISSEYCLSGTSQATAIETGRFIYYLKVH
jgi:subtilisin family serine protease